MAEEHEREQQEENQQQCQTENQQQNEEQKKQQQDSEESVKLFVGQVPKQMTETQLLELFRGFAIVDQVNVIKDKFTKASRGCCFVICPTREEADKAVLACHNKMTIPGASSPLQVKYADGELERLEHKLFVGMLPKNAVEDELSALFSKYGTITELQILKGSQQTSKGCSFLKYETKEQALAAIDSVNEKLTLEGSNVPLVVKWADTEKERQARRTLKAQSLIADGNGPSQNSVFGTLPVGYAPPYNGYGFQGPRSYGLVPYRVPTILPQGNALRGVRSNIYSGITPTSYIGSSYPSLPNVQIPLTYPGSLHSPGVTSPVSFSSSISQVEGPPGANLFIYRIPQEYGDSELASAFQPFGRVLSAKVFVDKATGLSKCFGFISYDSPTSAETAISKMNGFSLGNKKLKVQLKRDNKHTKPC